MKLRQLGRSELWVSELGLGCNNFGMRTGAAESAATIHAALDEGVNFFDTADVYGGTLSESFLGDALGSRRRDVIVATKFGLQLGVDDGRSDGSARHIISAVEQSLRRLKTDYIDLYQLHAPDPNTPLDETLRALADLTAQGKIRYAGCSNFSTLLIGEAHRAAAAARVEPFASVQNQFSLLAPDARTDVLPLCAERGIGLLPYFPLASGLLTGKYVRGAPPPEGSRIAGWGKAAAKVLAGDKIEKTERLAAWAAAQERSLLELAIGWLLAFSPVSSVIAGATSPQQVRANAQAAHWRLTPQDIVAIDAVLGSTPV